MIELLENTDFNRYVEYYDADDELQTIGIDLVCDYNGISVFVTLLLSDFDYGLIAEVLPIERFEDHDIHVNALTNESELANEIETLFSLANEGDSLVFFCDTEELLQQAFSVLGYHHH